MKSADNRQSKGQNCEGRAKPNKDWVAVEVILEERQERIIDILKNALQPMFLVTLSDQVRRLGAPPRKPVRPESAAQGRKSRAV